MLSEGDPQAAAAHFVMEGDVMKMKSKHETFNAESFSTFESDTGMDKRITSAIIFQVAALIFQVVCFLLMLLLGNR